MIRKAEETTDIWGKEGGEGCLLAPSHFSLSFFPHDTGHQPNPKGKLSLGVGTSGVSPFFHHGTAMRTYSLIRSGAIKPLVLIVFGETSGRFCWLCHHF